MTHDANTLYKILADLMPFVLEDYMPDFATPEFKDAVEAAKDAVAGAPIKELKGTCPLVLYFNDEADRSGFIAIAQAAAPNMKTLSI